MMYFRDRYYVLLAFSLFVVLYNTFQAESKIPIDVLLINEIPFYLSLYHHVPSMFNELKKLELSYSGAGDELYDIRYGLILTDFKAERCYSTYSNIEDLANALSNLLKTGFVQNKVADGGYMLPDLAKISNDFNIDIADNNLVTNRLDFTNEIVKSPDGLKSKSTMLKMIERMDAVWRDLIFGKCENWHVMGDVKEFWSKNNIRIVVHNTGVLTPNIYDMTNERTFSQKVEDSERYIAQNLKSERITYVKIAPLPRHLDEGVSPGKSAGIIYRYSCSIVPFYDANINIYDMKYRRYISGILVDHASSTPNLFVTDSKVRSITPLQRILPSFNKDPKDDIPKTYGECVVGGMRAALFRDAIALPDYNIAHEIRLIYGHRYQNGELSREQMRNILDNPYEDFYEKNEVKRVQDSFLHPREEEREHLVRNSAPNLFNLGVTDLLDTLFSNKKRIHKPYPNEIASRASDEVIRHILKNKIEKTSDLLAGGNSMIECLGLIFANKFLSNAYTLASHYIDENIGLVSIGELLKPMYVEPAFIISAAQAFYCTLIRDEHSLLRHKFMNSSHERCPFVYVVMYVNFDRLDSFTGRPAPYVNINILFDACKEESGEITWIPKESCMSPDPYLLPFGLRATLKNVRVLNIMDIIKSEDNLRNVNYSLNLSTKIPAVPDDFHIYECEARRCENHLLYILGFDTANQMYPYAIPSGAPTLYGASEHGGDLTGRCPFDRKVVPESYSAFNVKPFVPATSEEMIRIGKYDMGHIYSTVPHGGINRREDTLEYGLWDLITPDVNRHKYITDVAADMSQYNIDNCYSRLWAFNYTMNGRADFESHGINKDLLELSKIIRINGRPFVGMSYSPFIDDVT